MASPILDTEKDVKCLSKDTKLVENDIWSDRLLRKVKPENALLLDSRIPKQVISFDEKYLHHCLELLDVSALKVASCNIPSDSSAFLDTSSSKKNSSEKIYDLNELVIECHSAAGEKNVAVRSYGDSSHGAVTKSRSMLGILKNPLLRKSGDSDRGPVDVGEPIYRNLLNSCVGSHTTTSQNLHKDVVANREYRSGSAPVPVCRSLGSLSSTNSTCSDQSLSSATATLSQGMLHCTQNNDFPSYVFCVDDKREIYIANLLKVESPDNKILDYIYTFHSTTGKNIEDDMYVKESDLIGKMRVSTSFTILSDNSEIMETQFVLYGCSDDYLREMQNTSHTLTKNKGFAKKVVEVVKASQTYKHRNSTKLGISSAILENSALDPNQDATTAPVSSAILPEDHLVPNRELAAIIVKDHIPDVDNEADIGGWGMKFLKKNRNRQTNESLEVEVPSQSCVRNDGECSTSMHILIPAGFHGGPRTRNGGPSTLAERWKSGGNCDCGGWDLGCPITILNAKLSKKQILQQLDIHTESKTFDLFVEGSNQDSPTMKMVNIHESLYYIPFESNLSAIQALSIAAAIIHTRIPSLNPKLYNSK